MTPQANNPPDFVELFRDDLQRVISEKIDGEVDFEKTWQYMRLRKTDLYYRGLQFSAPNLQGGYADYTPVGTPMYPENLAQRGTFDYNMDIVATYGRRYFSILGLRPFHNVKGMPSDPSSELDRRAAEQAELAATWVKGIWNARIKNIELFYWQWKAGTVYPYIPYVADKQLFGEIKKQQFTDRTVQLAPGGYRCPNCGAFSERPQGGATVSSVPPEIACPHCQGLLSDLHYEDPVTAEVPEPQGMQSYAASGPALQFTTGYTTTIPFDCKDMKRSPYVLYEYEEDQGVLLQALGEGLRKLLDPQGNFMSADTSTAKAQGFLSRQQEFSLTAMPRISANSRWTYSRYWLATSMYEYVKDETKRKAMYEQYPDGLKAHMVQGRLVKLENENLADVWCAVVPEPGDAVYHDPQAWGILGQQDLINDWTNIIVAYGERGLPTHIVDVDVIDPDQLNSQSFMPNEVIGAKPGAGARLDSAVKTLAHTAFPEDMPAFIGNVVRPQVESYTGILPPAYGGGERQPTAEGQRTILNQALMQLGVPGEYASFGWADMLTMGVRQIAKHAPESFAVAVQGKGGNPSTSEMLDLEALRNGKWRLEPEPGVPMSFAEKRDQLSGIIKENPELAKAMGLDAPINLPVIRDYLLTGMHELRNPGEDLRDKVMLTVIPQLLQGQPTNGPDGSPQPSIMPEDFSEDPAECAELAKEWLNSPQGIKEKMSNPPGYANVLAWGMAQAAKVPPPTPDIKSSFSLSAKVEDFMPPVQSQMLGKVGIQVDPQSLAPPPVPPQGGPPAGPGGPPPDGPPGQGPPPPMGAGGPVIPQAQAPDQTMATSPILQ